MTAEQIQSVVTVAAFRPLDDSVLVIKRAADAKYNAGLYEIPGGKVDAEDVNKIRALTREGVEEFTDLVFLSGGTRLEDALVHREGRSTLLVSRYAAAVESGEKFGLTVEQKKDHSDFVFVNNNSYQALDFIREVRTFLDKIFAVHQTRGTLLPLLHQPVLIQPILLDYPGYCAHLVDRPLDEKNFLMPHEGVRDVLRRLLRPLFPRAPKVVLAKRLAALPTTFLSQEQSMPAWVLQYGIELAPHLVNSLDRTRTKSYAANVMPEVADPMTRSGLDLAQREIIMPSSLTKVHLPLRRAPLIIK